MLNIIAENWVAILVTSALLSVLVSLLAVVFMRAAKQLSYTQEEIDAEYQEQAQNVGHH